MEETICRVCLSPEEPSNLVSPCSCKGTQKYVHRECLSKWRKRSPGNFLSSSYCPVCKTSFMDVTPKTRVKLTTVGLILGMGMGIWLGSFLLFFLFALVILALKSGLRPKKMDVRLNLDRKRPTKSLETNSHRGPCLRPPRWPYYRSH